MSRSFHVEVHGFGFKTCAQRMGDRYHEEIHKELLAVAMPAISNSEFQAGFLGNWHNELKDVSAGRSLLTRILSMPASFDIPLFCPQ